MKTHHKVSLAMAALLTVATGCGTLIPSEKSQTAAVKAQADISQHQTVDTVRETQNPTPPAIRIRVYQQNPNAQKQPTK